MKFMVEEVLLSEKSRGIVIVGAGHAGCRAALALRTKGWDGRLCLINSEPGVPYERPPLSKSVLIGTKLVTECPMQPGDWLAENDIEYHSEIRAAAVRRDTKEIELSDGTAIPYCRLLLATGAEPRRLAVPGSSLPGVHFLRTALDATALGVRLLPDTRIVVVGGGLIGLEAAASAVLRGCKVTVVETSPRLLGRAVPPALEPLIRDLHERRGTSILLGRQVREIAGHEHVDGVVLDNGRRVQCDVVLVCIGVTPCVELAQSAGLAVDNGIVVNEFLQTADENIFAAGDVCSFPHALYGRRVRLECWKGAEDQGAVAAGNMLGGTEPFISVPWMWSDQFDQIIQVAGLLSPESMRVERSPEPHTSVIFDLASDGHVFAVSGFGQARYVGRNVRAGQEMIQRRFRTDPKLLSDSSNDLMQMVRGVTL